MPTDKEHFSRWLWGNGYGTRHTATVGKYYLTLEKNSLRVYVRDDTSDGKISFTMEEQEGYPSFEEAKNMYDTLRTSLSRTEEFVSG